MSKLLKNVAVLLLVIALFICLCLGKSTTPGPPGPGPGPGPLIRFESTPNKNIELGSHPYATFKITSSTFIPDNVFNGLIKKTIKDAYDTIIAQPDVKIESTLQGVNKQNIDSLDKIEYVYYESNYDNLNKNFIYTINCINEGVITDLDEIKAKKNFTSFKISDLPDACKAYPEYGYYDTSKHSELNIVKFDNLSKAECFKKYGENVNNKLVNFVEYDGNCYTFSSLHPLTCERPIERVF